MSSDAVYVVAYILTEPFGFVKHSCNNLLLALEKNGSDWFTWRPLSTTLQKMVPSHYLVQQILRQSRWCESQTFVSLENWVVLLEQSCYLWESFYISILYWSNFVLMALALKSWCGWFLRAPGIIFLILRPLTNASYLCTNESCSASWTAPCWRSQPSRFSAT